MIISCLTAAGGDVSPLNLTECSNFPIKLQFPSCDILNENIYTRTRKSPKAACLSLKLCARGNAYFKRYVRQEQLTKPSYKGRNIYASISYIKTHFKSLLRFTIGYTKARRSTHYIEGYCS